MNTTIVPREFPDTFGNTLYLYSSGQQGPYKGSFWAGRVEIARSGLNHEDMVRSLVEPRVGEGHIFGVDVRRPFAAPYFTRLEQLTPNQVTGKFVWEFQVQRDYLD